MGVALKGSPPRNTPPCILQCLALYFLLWRVGLVPLYEYQCLGCGAKDERYVSLHKYVLLQTCNKCGAEVKRLVSLFHSTNPLMTSSDKKWDDKLFRDNKAYWAGERKKATKELKQIWKGEA